MQFVYFLLLPSALLSNFLQSSATNVNDVGQQATQAVDWRVLLNIWMVIGCFGLSARWLEKAQRQCFDAIVTRNNCENWVASEWVFRNRDSLLIWLWCLLQPICLVASGWTRWTQHFMFAPSSQAMDIAVMLVPSALLLLLIELIRSSRRVSNLIYDRKEIARTIASTWLFPIAIPICIAVLVDLSYLTNIFGPDRGLFGAIVSTITISAMITVLTPHLFTRLIGAEPIDDSVALTIERTWRLGSESVPRILLWPTGCRMANAAVVGLFRFGRKLLLTDALLQKLNDQELSMVVLHELAHCVRYHAWLRMLPTLAAVALLLGAMTFFSGICLSMICVAILGFFIASLISICWWTEFDADRVAIELAIRSEDGLRRDNRVSVHVQELCDALNKIYGSKNRRQSSWMHPSCSRRIAAIRLFSDRSRFGGG